MESPSHYPDGPLDQVIDVSHLSEKGKQVKRNAYNRWTVPDGTITTAAGQIVKFDLGRDESLVKVSQLSWKVDGQVSAAVVSCKRCAEINSCREEGTPPFICLVRAGGYRRSDGTSQCAYCFCNSFGGCKAQCGEFTISDEESSDSEKSEGKNKERKKAQKNFGKRGRPTKAKAKRVFQPSSPTESDDSSLEDDQGKEPQTGDSLNDEENRRYSQSGRELQPVKRFIPIEGAKKRRRASVGTAKTINQKGDAGDLASSDIRVPVIMVGRREHSLTRVTDKQNEYSLHNFDDGESLSATSSMTMYHNETAEPASVTPKSSVQFIAQHREAEVKDEVTNDRLRQAQEEYEKAAEEVLALKRAKYVALLKGRES